MARAKSGSPPPPRRDEAHAEIGPRRQARECALQVLYALDTAQTLGSDELGAALHAYWANLDAPADAREYADELSRGVLEHLEAIDDAIGAASRQWRIERMPRVDRNVMRVAVQEILFGDSVPARVAIDEAIDVARRFGTHESAAFVNGILDRIARNAGKL